jgi:hypothetical protein
MTDVTRLTLNRYTCRECGGSIVTVDREAGTTPMLIDCKTPGCTGRMGSSFYRVDQHSVPTWEWYRPGKAELKRLSDVEREHVKMGGLLLRKIETGT